MKKVYIFLIITLLLNSATSFAKSKKDKAHKGFRFELTIEGNHDSVMYMGCYYMGDTPSLDTAYCKNRNGVFVFENKQKSLLPGLYFFVNGSGKYVEFVVYKEKLDFKFYTKQSDWTHNMTVKGSVENELFYQFHRRSYEISKEIDAQRSVLDSAAFEQFKRERRMAVDQIKLDIIKQHPESMLAQMTNATRPIDPPVVNEQGDSLTNRQRYEYYVTHFWDNFPLHDDFLVRTPRDVFKTPLMNYMDRNLQGLPPTLLEPYLDSLIERSRPSKENFKYLVHTITEHYLQTKVMVYDEVYVHLVKRYWATGQTFWSEPSVIQEQIDRAERWDKILVGRVAPELLTKDTNGFVHSLHRQAGDFKLLVFWSPSCGHCKTMIPELHEVWKKLIQQYRISVYAVMTEPDENTVKKWKNFINEKDLDGWFHMNGGEANVNWREVYDVETTPQIFLLNSENQIIAKKLDPQLFERIINEFDPEK